MNINHRHKHHDTMAALIEQGLTDTEIARQLGTDRRPVARVRRIIGAQPCTNGTTVEAKLAKYSTVLAGHTFWHGRVSSTGVPVMRHRGKGFPASHAVFEQHYGRPPVGYVRSDCDVPHCLTPQHLLDDLGRRQVRMQLRALYGLDPAPWGECQHGHPWDEFGRVEVDLTVYCKRCNNERKVRLIQARKAEA